VRGTDSRTLKAPSSEPHVGGLEAQPHEYERRVIAFFDRALAS
jgi:hypothetical protein